MEKATFGGGCFWCTEAMFQAIKGVQSVESGYSGGHTDKPGYREVCAGNTGHAEVVQIVFSPDEVSYSDLLRMHIASHDPTTLNKQGADTGTQYRSVIFTHNDAQADAAKAVIEEMAPLFNDPIVTEIAAFEASTRQRTTTRTTSTRMVNSGIASWLLTRKCGSSGKCLRNA